MDSIYRTGALEMLSASPIFKFSSFFHLKKMEKGKVLSAVDFPRKNKQEPRKEPLPCYPLITTNIPDSEKQPDETTVCKPRINVYH